MPKSKLITPNEPQDQPVWYLAEAPLGSAAKFIASLSPHFNRVSISKIQKKKLRPFVSLGDVPLQKRGYLTVPVLNKNQNLLGQIEIHSHIVDTFTQDEIDWVNQVSHELGELWPA